MTTDIGNKFSKFVEALETSELGKIGIGDSAIEFDPESIEFGMVNYDEDNSRIVASGDVAGTTDYDELWIRVLGTAEYDRSDCNDLSAEQMLEVANFQRLQLAGAVEHVIASVDVISERYSFEMEESE